MGTAMVIMGVIGGVGMAANIGKAGYDGDKSSANLRKQISDVEDQTRQWTNKYNELGKADSKIDQDFIDATTNSLSKYSQLQAELKLESENFEKQYRIIQETGVIIISIVFFLLVLKQLGLFGPIWQAITIPERYVIQKIKDMKKK
jgi:hypothetical protein